MELELERHSIFELVDKLYQLAKFNGGSFTLKSGAIKRVFIEDEHDEAVIMYNDKDGDYAIDAGGLACFTAIKNFERDYPEAYQKFAGTYEAFDESKAIVITPENAAEFKKILDSEPS